MSLGFESRVACEAGEPGCYEVGMLHGVIDDLARTRVLGALLESAHARWGGYELVAHWSQGEFHHDVVLRLPVQSLSDLPGRVLVVATNCNGGVKEVLCLAEVPVRAALWHHRVPGNPDFAGDLGPVLARAVTEHWFDPGELLGPGARSELRPEFRERQSGGGWICAKPPSSRRASAGHGK